MYSLINGKPVFYIGKINGVGYTTEEEKNDIISRLKEDNPDIEIKDEPVKINKELKEKAMELSKLQLTYSKSEFMKYLNGEKHIPGLKEKELEQQNKVLSEAITELANLVGQLF